MQQSVPLHRPLARLGLFAACALAGWFMLARAAQGDISRRLTPHATGDSYHFGIARADTDTVGLYRVDSLLAFIRLLGADSLRALVQSMDADPVLWALVDSLAPVDTNYRTHRYLDGLWRRSRIASTLPRQRRSLGVNPFGQHGIELDSASFSYRARETVGEDDIRIPQLLSRDLYRRRKMEASLERNWHELIALRRAQQQRRQRGGLGLSITVPGGRQSGFTTIFGKNEVDLRVTGTADIRAGFAYRESDQQVILGQAARVDPDFEMSQRLSVTGTIGDKMQVGVDWDTNRQFDFENQLKLQYTGYEDEIIQSIEAGNVFLQTPSSLIRGGQSLFGVKSEFQVGGFRLTTVASQQEGESSVLSLEGGAETTAFDARPTDYNERMHYFLSYYFRNRWEQALSDPPNIILDAVFSGITDLEVWKLTPVAPEEQNVRQVVAVVDLGEPSDLVILADGFTQAVRPDEDIDQYSEAELASQLRPGDAVPKDYLESAAMEQPLVAGDFQVGQFKKLARGRDYEVDELLGYITLLQRIQESEALAVSFRYLANGTELQVGDFSSETGGGDNSQTGERIVLKLLKPVNLQQPANTGQDNELNPAAWHLEMRNIYRLGTGLQPSDFILNIEHQPPGRSASKTLPGIGGQSTLIQLLGLDRLNEDGAQKPDDLFDFLINYTVNQAEGTVIFPYLEPFGNRIEALIDASDLGPAEKAEAKAVYVFSDLYRTKQINAVRNTQLNVYRIQGSFSGGIPSFYDLRAFSGLVEGSVRVSSGGVSLAEGTDYVVDYQGGTVEIINPAFVTAGRDITIESEQNALVNFQKKTLLGGRMDYSTDERFAVGGTFMRLSQKSITDKFRIGEEPIANFIWGLDGQLALEPTWLTRAIDAVPLIQTRAPSSIDISGEVAQLRPGHTLTNAFKLERRDLRSLGRDFYPDETQGISYVDDFEGFENLFTLMRPGAWQLASAPILGAEEELAGPEVEYPNSSRATLGWYQLNVTAREHLGNPTDPAVLLVRPQDVFPNRDPSTQERILTTLDYFFTPHERGPYNYNLDLGGFLDDPKRAWGGMTQRLTEGNTDFTSKNIEFIEFVFQPFPQGGDADPDARLYIDIGRISEDVIPDNKLNTEDGLSLTEGGPVGVHGRLSTGQQNQTINPITGSDRITEDLGLDGLASFADNKFEREGGLGTEQAHFTEFLASLDQTTSARFPQLLEREKIKARRDPSGDDYHYFLDDGYFADARLYPGGASVQQRFSKFFGGHELNSYEAQTKLADATTARGNSRIPDSEDINLNSAPDTDNSYFQYELPLSLATLSALAAPEETHDYVINEIATPSGAGTGWYLVRIPVKDYSRKVGAIQDFTLIESIRVWTTGHSRPITLRFATLEFVGSQWRRSEAVSSLDADGEVLPPEDPVTGGRISIESVNNEENTIYEIPNGAIRNRIREAQTATLRDAREQSMVLRAENIKPNAQQAVFHTWSSPLDLLKYSNLRMFVHLNGFKDDMPLEEEDRGEVKLFVRLGANETSDFYEYEQPLTPSPLDQLPETSEARADYLWRTHQPNPESGGEGFIDLNSVNVRMSALNQLKFHRDEIARETELDPAKTFWNDEHGLLGDIIAEFAPPGTRIGVKGTPSLARVNTIVLGLRNTSQDGGVLTEATVWVNELRVSGYDENTGLASVVNLDVALADLARVKGTLRAQTDGFGSLSSSLGERDQTNSTDWTVNTQMNLDKFVSERYGWTLPVSVEMKSVSSIPRFDPSRGDVRVQSLQEAIASDSTLMPEEIDARQRAIQEQAQTRTETRSYTSRIGKNGSRTRLLRSTVDAVSLNYSYSSSSGRTPSETLRESWRWNSTLGYRLSVRRPRVLRPLGFLGRVPVIRVFSNIGFSYLPTSVNYSLSADRNFTQSKRRPDPVRPRDTSVPIDVEFPVRPQHRFSHARQFAIQYSPLGFLNLSLDANTNQSLNAVGVDTLYSVILVDSLGEETRLDGTRLTSLLADGTVDSSRVGVSAFELENLQSLGVRQVMSRVTGGSLTPTTDIRTERYQSRFSATFRPRLQQYRFLSWLQFQDVGYSSTFSWRNGSVSNNTGARVSTSVTLRSGVTVRPQNLFEKFGFYTRLQQAQRAAENAAAARRTQREAERERRLEERRIERERRRQERREQEAREEAGLEAEEEPAEQEDEPEQAPEPGLAVPDFEAAADTTRRRLPGIPFLPNPVSLLRKAVLAATGVQDINLTYTGSRTSNATNVGRFGEDDRVEVSYSLRDALFSGHGPPIRYRLGLDRTIDPASQRIISDRLQVTDALADSDRLQGRTTINPTRSLRISLSWTLESSTREDFTYRPLPDGSPGADTTSSGDVRGSVWAFTADYQELFRRQLDRFREDCGTVCETEGILADSVIASTVLTNGVVFEDFLGSYLTGPGGTLGSSGRVPFPLPSWQISYSGISRWPIIRSLTQSATLRHSYNADYSADFRSNLRGGQMDMFNLGQGPRIAYTLQDVDIDAVRVNERFQPLVAVDLSLKGNVQTSVAWNKSNSYSLSTTNNVVNEAQTNDISITASYATRNLRLPLFGRRLNNRISFSVQASRSVNNDRSFYIRRAMEVAAIDAGFTPDMALVEPFVDILTSTARIQITPKIAYQFSNQVTADVFVEYEDFQGDSRRLPYKSINGGFNFRLSFAH